MDRKKIGTLLLILGILAWPIGFALEKAPTTILPFHLLGVIPGVILRGSKILKRFQKAG
jgi:hypothetical protein